MTRRKRGYSKDFTPRNPETAPAYKLDRIPPALWTRVRAKAQRDGVSVRALLLRYLTTWVES